MKLKQTEPLKTKALVNQQGQITGELTPKQKQLVESYAFDVGVKLYRRALNGGQITAESRREALNLQLEKVFNEEDLANSPSANPTYR